MDFTITVKLKVQPKHLVALVTFVLSLAWML